MSKITKKDIQHNTQLLKQASEHGDIAEVERLIPISDPKAHNNAALRWAARNGHLEIVKMLLPVSDPAANESAALAWAAEKGHTDIVKLLIPVSHPKDSAALAWAAGNEHIECVKLLIPVSDFNNALSILQEEDSDTTLLQRCVDEYEALTQKDRLHNTLTEMTDNKYNSVKRKI